MSTLLAMSNVSPIVNPTHELRDPGPHETCGVRAWRYLKTNPIPLWVVRNFHDLGNARLTHRSGYSVPEGDWIIDLGGIATVLTDQEFNDTFIPLSS